MKLVVAIDGPAGTGKSSAAQYLASHLYFTYVDTGAIYRALALLTDRHGVSPGDTSAIVALIPLIKIEVDEEHFKTRITIEEKEVSSELRTEHISKLSSMVSQHQDVREALLTVQRDLVYTIKNGAIFEGRDIGTVVFPNAHVKIFITANAQTRAKRRFQEIKTRHPEATYDEVLEAILRRDERDEKRQNAPMQQASDAHVIDTSHMTLKEVIEDAMAIIVKAQSASDKGRDLW